MGKNRRRKIIVDPKLQYSLVTSFFIVFMVASGIYYATMSFALLEAHTIAETLQLPPEHPILSGLERLERSATSAFIATFLGFGVVVIWGGFYLSRKIAGPIFALRRHLDRVAEGETDDDLSFRKGDYFSELQNTFNAHMHSYRRRLAAANDD